METIRLEGIVGWDLTAEALHPKLPKDLEEPVNIYINSNGGDPFEGFAIYQLLSGRSNLTVELGGIVASAASYIPLAADTIIANETSTWMAHKAWSIVAGNADEMNKKANILSGIDGLIAGAYSKKNGKSKEEMLTAMAEETWLFGGEAIKEFGIATEVKTSEDEADINENAVRSMVQATLSSFKDKVKPKVLNVKADLSEERERIATILASNGINDGLVKAVKDGVEYKPSEPKVTEEFLNQKLKSVKLKVNDKIAQIMGKI